MNTLKHTGKIRNIETEQQTMYTLSLSRQRDCFQI